MYAIKHYAKVKLSRLLMNGFSKGTNSAQAGYDAGRGAINLRGGGVSVQTVLHSIIVEVLYVQHAVILKIKDLN